MKKILAAIMIAALLAAALPIGVPAQAAGVYDPAAAAAYALKYWQNYNPNYSNYNSIGGDCCNFVSQCLHAGGLQMDGSWFWYSYSNHSASWTLCTALKTYLVGTLGCAFIPSPSAAQIDVGDVLYFNNGGHVMICSEKINGQVWVCGHNADRHYTNWNWGNVAVIKLGNLTRTTVSLDVNLNRNGEILYTGLDEVTFDVYINNALAANDVKDFYGEYGRGTSYTVNDIKTAGDYELQGDGAYTGALNGNAVVNIPVAVVAPTLMARGIYQDRIYEVYKKNSTWESARARAETLGGHLVTVTSAQEQAAVAKLLPELRGFWIGATDEAREGVWQWVTGEPFDYANWHPDGQPDNYNGNENYCHIYGENGYWNDIDATVLDGYIVEYEPQLAHTLQAYGHTYEIYVGRTNWKAAEAFAEEKGGYLAAITSEEEQEQIGGILDSVNFWIGATDEAREGEWKWVTGEPFQYTNWHPDGQPDNYNGNENYCHINGENGYWNDLRCDEKNMQGFIVEYEQPLLEKTMVFNGHAYAVYRCNTSWPVAARFAEENGGYLAVITSEEEQQMLAESIADIREGDALFHMPIQLFSIKEDGETAATVSAAGASDLTDTWRGEVVETHYWIGATDAAQEGNWQWISGEPFVYTHWAENEPNNQDGSEHYAMIYFNGSWNDGQINNMSVGGFIVEYNDPCMFGHDYSAWMKLNDDDHCRVSSRNENHVIIQAHNWGEAEVTKEPTAAQPGIRVRVCKDCGAIKTELIPQLLPAYIPGDVDENGKVTAADARLALRRAVGLETFAVESAAFLAADVNGDGKVTAADARLILRVAVGMEKLA